MIAQLIGTNRSGVVACVVAALVLSACTHGVMSDQQGMVSPTTESPSSDSSASVSPSPSTDGVTLGKHVPGVKGEFCRVSSAAADLGVGTEQHPDRVYVFTRGAATPCRHGRVFIGLAPDGGRVRAITRGGRECHRGCRVIAFPDVTGDGVPDIAIGGTGPGIAFFDLFVVEKNPTRVVQLHGPRGRGWGFAVGGTYQSMGGLICVPGPTLVSWGASETAEGNGPYSVRMVTFHLEGSTVIRQGARFFSLVQANTQSLPERGGVALGTRHGICGARVLTRSFYR
jgi:hypothetical protein